MACNWVMMTSSGEDNWPWEFGSAHRQKKQEPRCKKPPSLRLRGLIITRTVKISRATDTNTSVCKALKRRAFLNARKYIEKDIKRAGHTWKQLERIAQDIGDWQVIVGGLCSGRSKGPK